MLQPGKIIESPAQSGQTQEGPAAERGCLAADKSGREM